MREECLRRGTTVDHHDLPRHISGFIRREIKRHAANLIGLTNPPDRIEVNVYRDGRLKVAGQFLTLDELRAQLEQAQQRYADQAVMIRADGRNAYQSVIDVLSVCEKAQIKHFSLAARVEGEETQ